MTSAGALVSSKPVTIYVERADWPVKLEVPASVTTRLVGETLPLTILGVFPGGAVVDLTHSSKLICISENASVAIIQDGMFSAMGVGQTNVDVRSPHCPHAARGQTRSLIMCYSVPASGLPGLNSRKSPGYPAPARLYIMTCTSESR